VACGLDISAEIGAGHFAMIGFLYFITARFDGIFGYCRVAKEFSSAERPLILKGIWIKWIA